MQDTIWFALIILCLLFFFYVYTCIKENADCKRLKESMTEQAVDSIDFYDSKGNIKERAHEIREITYRKKAK
jgi:hypothetical protein